MEVPCDPCDPACSTVSMQIYDRIWWEALDLKIEAWSKWSEAVSVKRGNSKTQTLPAMSSLTVGLEPWKTV